MDLKLTKKEDRFYFSKLFTIILKHDGEFKHGYVTMNLALKTCYN